MSIRQSFSRWRVWLLSIAALGFGAIGVAGTHGFIAEQIDAEKARLNRAHQSREIVVARKDLPAGTILQPELLATRAVPDRYVSASAVAGDDYEPLMGQVLQVAMRAGEPVLNTAVDLPAAGFSDRVRHGIRAMTVQVDDVNSVSGMLRPGDRIDLLFATRSPLANEGGLDISRPLMQDLPVLATGSSVHDGKSYGHATDGFTTITVEVTPTQAQKLVLAQRSGRLTALLRNPDDRHPIPANAMDVFELLGLDKPGRQKSGKTVEMIVGGQGRLPVPSGRQP
ncbi:MAG: Flp pilus assembly protein CpaB [Burkholderiaceae bacterium]